MKLFLQKNRQFFERRGLRAKTLEAAPPIADFLQISSYVPESNHVLALLIFILSEFSLMCSIKLA